MSHELKVDFRERFRKRVSRYVVVVVHEIRFALRWIDAFLAGKDPTLAKGNLLLHLEKYYFCTLSYLCSAITIVSIVREYLIIPANK